MPESLLFAVPLGLSELERTTGIEPAVSAWEAGGLTIRWCSQAETSPFEGPFGGLSDCCLPANLSRFGLPRAGASRWSPLSAPRARTGRVRGSPLDSQGHRLSRLASVTDATTSPRASPDQRWMASRCSICLSSGVEATGHMLAAAHNRDLTFAQRAGLGTAFIPRPTELGPDQTKDLAGEGDWDFVSASILEFGCRFADA